MQLFLSDAPFYRLEVPIASGLIQIISLVHSSPDLVLSSPFRVRSTPGLVWSCPRRESPRFRLASVQFGSDPLLLLALRLSSAAVLVFSSPVRFASHGHFSSPCPFGSLPRLIHADRFRCTSLPIRSISLRLAAGRINWLPIYSMSHQFSSVLLPLDLELEPAPFSIAPLPETAPGTQLQRHLNAFLADLQLALGV